MSLHWQHRAVVEAECVVGIVDFCTFKDREICSRKRVACLCLWPVQTRLPIDVQCTSDPTAEDLLNNCGTLYCLCGML